MNAEVSMLESHIKITTTRILSVHFYHDQRANKDDFNEWYQWLIFENVT